MPYASMKFMDTSVDYDTAFNQFGSEKLGVEPMLRPGVAGLDGMEFFLTKEALEEGTVPLGGLGAVSDVASLMKLLSDMEQAMIREELRVSPKFRQLLSAAAKTENPRQALKLSAQRALVNELDPSKWPDAKGLWIGLRKKFRAGYEALPKIISREAGKMTFADKVKFLEDYARGKAPRVNLSHYDEEHGGLGFYDLIGSLANVAGGVYTGKLMGDTQKDIAKIQAGVAAQQTAAQIQIAKAKQAIAEAQVKQTQEQAKVEEAKAERIKVAGVITQEVAGIPMWALVLGVLALGLGGYFLFFRR